MTPMTPEGKATARGAGEYAETLTCLGDPRCKRGTEARRAAQAPGLTQCGMCRREYQYVED